MKFIVGMLTGVVIAGTVFVLGLPHCPAEDSCEPAYKHHHGLIHYGYWTGTEVTP